MTCLKPRLLDPKMPGEVIPVTFDFTGLTTAPSAPTITVAWYSGTADAGPALTLSGAPQVVGAQVIQLMAAGLDDAVYYTECTADSPDGARYTVAALLPVCTANPAL